VILSQLASGRNPGLVGGLQSGSPGGADGVAAAGVFVVGCDVAQALVQADLVVEVFDSI
jgi:hypothetical protein